MAEPKAFVIIPKSKSKGTEIEYEMCYLVLCKNCKYFHAFEYNNGKSGQCDEWMASTESNGFCFVAEAR